MSEEMKRQKLKCPICDKEFETAIAFKRHQNIHSEKFKCKICGMCSGSHSNLKRHSKIHGRRERRHKCNLCLSKFYHVSVLCAHIKRHHPTRCEDSILQQFKKCKFCDKMFLHAEAVKRHMNIHLERFPCQDCGKYLLSATNLKQHQQVHINKKYKCLQCKRGFRFELELNIHQQNCHGVRHFKCPVCSKDFLTKQGLRCHVNIHLERYKCDVCDKCCYNRSQLNAHMKIHASGKKVNKFHCSRCLRAFLFHDELKTHVQECNKIQHHLVKEQSRTQEHSASSTTTSSENNVDRLSITCDYCSKVCENKNSLKQHCLDNHLGTFRAYSCQSCQYASSNQRLMLAHCRKEHRDAKLFKQNIPNDEETELLSGVFDTLRKKQIDMDLVSVNIKS